MDKTSKDPTIDLSQGLREDQTKAREAFASQEERNATLQARIREQSTALAPGFGRSLHNECRDHGRTLLNNFIACAVGGVAFTIALRRWG